MLILASKSPRRKEILASLGIPFEVIPSEVEELSPDSCCIEHLPVMNARLKSECIAARFPHKLVLGADTIVELGDKIIEKPSDKAEALEMLMSLSGREHQVVTAVCLTRKCDDLSITFSERSIVEFNNFNRSTAEEYIRKVHVLDKAGAYSVQEYGEIIIRKIEGSVTNVIGLPVEKLLEALKSLK